MCLNLYLFNKLPLGVEFMESVGLPLYVLNSDRSHNLKRTVLMTFPNNLPPSTRSNMFWNLACGQRV